MERYVGYTPLPGLAAPQDHLQEKKNAVLSVAQFLMMSKSSSRRDCETSIRRQTMIVPFTANTVTESAEKAMLIVMLMPVDSPCRTSTTRSLGQALASLRGFVVSATLLARMLDRRSKQPELEEAPEGIRSLASNLVKQVLPRETAFVARA